MIRYLALAAVLAFVLLASAHLSTLASSPIGPGPIPAGYLPFLGGGEGDPFAAVVDPPAANAMLGPIPARFLPFLGGGEGTP